MWHWDHLRSQNCKIAHKEKSIVGKTKRKVRVGYILVDRIWNMKYWNSLLIATLNTSSSYQMWLYGIQKLHKSFWGVSWSVFFSCHLACIVKRFVCCPAAKDIAGKTALRISSLSSESWWGSSADCIQGFGISHLKSPHPGVVLPSVYTAGHHLCTFKFLSLHAQMWQSPFSLLCQ